MVFTAGLLVVSFDRPLFPVKTLVRTLQQSYPDSRITHSLSRLYGVNPSNIGENRDTLSAVLPREGETIGYSNCGVIEPDLWFPLGSRKVAEVWVEDSPEQLRSLGIRYVVIEDLFLKLSNQTIEQWATAIIREHDLPLCGGPRSAPSLPWRSKKRVMFPFLRNRRHWTVAGTQERLGRQG